MNYGHVLKIYPHSLQRCNCYLCIIQSIIYHGSSSLVLLATTCSLTLSPLNTQHYVRDTWVLSNTMCQTHVPHNPHVDFIPSQWVRKTHPSNATNPTLPITHHTTPTSPVSPCPPNDISGFSPSIIIGPSPFRSAPLETFEA